MGKQGSATMNRVGEECRVVISAPRHPVTKGHKAACRNANEALTDVCARDNLIPTNVRLLWMKHGDDPTLEGLRDIPPTYRPTPQITFYCFSATAARAPRTPLVDRMLKRMGLQRIAPRS